MDSSRWPSGTLYPQKVGNHFSDRRRSLGRSRTQTMEFSFLGGIYIHFTINHCIEARIKSMSSLNFTQQYFSTKRIRLLSCLHRCWVATISLTYKTIASHDWATAYKAPLSAVPLLMLTYPLQQTRVYSSLSGISRLFWLHNSVSHLAYHSIVLTFVMGTSTDIFYVAFVISCFLSPNLILLHYSF
jgi:hypothetical protein